MSISLVPARDLATARPRRRTVPRERLHRLLDADENRRLVLVLAGPGFGKTTLLDGLRRSAPGPTASLRLDEGHRDPKRLARDLAASLRRGSAAVAAGLPAAVSTPEGEVRELPAVAPDDPPVNVGAAADPRRRLREQLHRLADRQALLLLDGIDALAGSSESLALLSSVLTDGPTDLTIVLAGRHRPALDLDEIARDGEIAEIGPSELAFDRAEISTLLGESSPSSSPGIEADRIDRVVAETGGWPIAVARIADALAGGGGRALPDAVALARAELGPYIEAEAIGSLPPDLRPVTPRIALLEHLTPSLVAAALDRDAASAARLIDALAELGFLVVDPDDRGLGLRLLPPIAAALEARLRRDEPSLVPAIHRRVAVAAGPAAWRVAAAHLRAAGDEAAVGSLIGRCLDSILDRGDAAEALDALPSDHAGTPLARILASRAAFRHERLDRAVALAAEALEAARQLGSSNGELIAIASENARRIALVAGDERLHAMASRIARDPAIGGVSGEIAPSSEAPGPEALDLGLHERRIRAALAGAPPEPSYRGAAGRATLGSIHLARGSLAEAVAESTHAAEQLSRTGSGREVGLASVTAAFALALLGRWREATVRMGEAIAAAPDDPSVISAVAELHSWCGDPLDAARAADEAVRLAAGAGAAAGTAAATDRATLGLGPVLDPGLIPRTAVRVALDAAIAGTPDAEALGSRAVAVTAAAGASLWVEVARAIVAFRADAASTVVTLVASGQPHGPIVLALLSPYLVLFLADLDPAAAELVRASIDARPERWRGHLRRGVSSGSTRARLAAARALARVGSSEDVALLAMTIRSARARGDDAQVAKHLARRLAPPIFVDDLGRVGIAAGALGRAAGGRRKVLALICYLLTRPDLAAARDQVLDALWPDQDPETAANSLNQTVYFLRRTLEGDYADERSPDYIHHDSEVVWLDPDLVTSRSRICRDLVARSRGGRDGEVVDELSRAYGGRFALDFSYEPWAEAYRESLHAGYLGAIEGAIASAAAEGATERGILLATRALEIDPGAEAIELALLRLYRSSGAHAAAAEQYAHYAGVLRDELGLEPPPLDQL